MFNFFKTRTKNQYIALFGVLSVIIYFLHVIIGTALYTNYNSLTQAISDLTAEGAKSATVARIFSNLYGFFSMIFCIILLIIFNKKSNKIFYSGLITLFIMFTVSFFGYLLFPLSGNSLVMNFQNIMHIVVTAIVVLSTIIALFLIGLGILKSGKYKWLAVIAFLCLLNMIIGGILTGAGPKSLLGLFERINIFSLQFFITVFSLWTFFRDNDVLLYRKSNGIIM